MDLTAGIVQKFQMSLPSAARGVTNVIERCETAKTTGMLDLSESSLMYIADAIYLVLKGYEVNKVSLKGNHLKKFPKKMLDKFPNMQLVNCAHNEIAELPEELAEWSKVKAVNAAYNNLKEVPECVLAMERLTLLDLSHNKITEVDVDRILSMKSLAQLNLSNNPLSESSRQKLKTCSSKVKISF